MSMTRAELQSLHESLCGQARETQARKNHDYASESDIFRNFRYFGGLGILVRMSDKLARLRSFEENGIFKVEDEKLADTIQDLINYAVIYYAFKHDGKPTPPICPEMLSFIAKKDNYDYSNPTPPKVIEITMPKVVDGPYCENCERLATYRHDNGTFWCRFCYESRYDLNPITCTLLETA